MSATAIPKPYYHMAESFIGSSTLSSHPNETPQNHWDKLPAEMRTKIYGYVLADAHARQEVPLTVIKEVGKRINVLCHDKPDTRIATVLSQLRHLFHTNKSRTAILQLNKNIHAEGLQVLYGTCGFIIKDFPDLKAVIPRLGPGTKYLRHLRIITYSNKHAKSVATVLLPAANLRTLTFGHAQFCRMYWGGMGSKALISIAQLVKSFTPLLAVLHEEYQIEGVEECVLDVLRQFHEGCEECGLKKGQGRVLVRVGERVRLVRSFGISEEGRKV